MLTASTGRRSGRHSRTSGGGKTTLLRLLLGQLRTGRRRDVLIAGQSIDDIDLVAWRERVAWMTSTTP